MLDVVGMLLVQMDFVLLIWKRNTSFSVVCMCFFKFDKDYLQICIFYVVKGAMMFVRSGRSHFCVAG